MSQPDVSQQAAPPAGVLIPNSIKDAGTCLTSGQASLFPATQTFESHTD